MNVDINGASLEDFGFTDLKSVDGIGLLTRGFVLNCSSDWIQPGSVTTNWTQPAGISTMWAGATNTIFGDC